MAVSAGIRAEGSSAGARRRFGFKDRPGRLVHKGGKPPDARAGPASLSASRHATLESCKARGGADSSTPGSGPQEAGSEASCSSDDGSRKKAKTSLRLNDARLIDGVSPGPHSGCVVFALDSTSNSSKTNLYRVVVTHVRTTASLDSRPPRGRTPWEEGDKHSPPLALAGSYLKQLRPRRRSADDEQTRHTSPLEEEKGSRRPFSITVCAHRADAHRPAGIGSRAGSRTLRRFSFVRRTWKDTTS